MATSNCAPSSARSAVAEQRTTVTRLAEAHARLEAIDGYAARSRAATLLAGLGFSAADLERPGGGLLRRLAHAPQPRAARC